jgi:hypothetical protein
MMNHTAGRGVAAWRRRGLTRAVVALFLWCRRSTTTRSNGSASRLIQ